MIDARELTRKLILATARYSGAAALAQPIMSGSGAILMLHSVTRAAPPPLALNSHLSIRPEFLDRLLTDVKAAGNVLVSLDELVAALPSPGRRRLMAITSDDGYYDNLTEALPVLEKHQAPMTIFITAGLTGGKVEPWWEAVEHLVTRRDVVHIPASGGPIELDCGNPAAKRAAALRIVRYLTREISEEQQQDVLRRMGAFDAGVKPAARRFVNWDEVRQLHAHPLVTIGAHTVHHYNLKRLDADTALHEMVQSASIIEAETGERPRHFAYPYGSRAAAAEREMELAREAGFTSAVTTRHGVLHRGHAQHPHALPRISINGRYQRLGYVRTLLSGLTTPLANKGRRLVTV